VRGFLWDTKEIPLEQTQEILEQNEQLFHQSRFGIWGVREHKSPELMGFAGFWHFRTPPNLELLFGVAPNHWNRGVATEASSSVIRYGFEILNFDKIEASTDFANNASIRVLEKLSMTLRQRATVNGLDTVFYGLTRDEWLRSTA
jgi:RimJ/RimL family protein N-acetyltransferase